MNEVFEAINSYGANRSTLVVRYLYRNHPIPEQLKANFKLNIELGNELVRTDRYPFYNVIPAQFNRN